MRVVFFLLSLFALQSQETTLFMVRHGETDDNIKNVYCGQSTDIPLNERGKEQAERLAEEILKNHPDITAIYSSDLSRAVATAEPSAKVLNLPIQQNENLREIDWGKGEGLTQEDKHRLYGESLKAVALAHPEMRDRWNYPIFPEAETFNQLHERLARELQTIAKRHPGEKVLIFSHGRAIKTLISADLNTEENPSLKNCQVAHFTLSSDDPSTSLHFIGMEDF